MTHVTINTHQNFDLSTHNTMALSCFAKRAYLLDHETDIDKIFEQLTEEKSRILILSGGSNVLLPQKLNATVIIPCFQGVNLLQKTEKHVEIEVMAGNNWHQLVTELTNKGWYGIENLVSIPGLVGASPVQNIGAYGVQLEDCLTHVTAYHIPSKQWKTLTKEQCQFAYRDSLFKQQPNTWFISRVGLRLHKDPTVIHADYGDVQQQAEHLAKENKRDNIQPIDVMKAIISIRQAKLPDPKVLANTGSFFQNPIIKRQKYIQLLEQFDSIPKYDIDDELVKIPAAWLIDQAGLKGKGIAPILTHKKQALVLINHAPYKATQTDILNTQNLIIKNIKEKYGIKLCPEPVWID